MDKQTPLYNKHKALGAKLIPFGGFIMPVWYKGIVEEYQAVRERVGLFDLNHMGEILITGEDKDKLVDYLITNDLKKIDFNEILYSFLCDEEGFILDDLLVYLYGEGTLLVVNAGQADMVMNHIKKYGQGFNCNADNISEKTGLLAIQGPDSFKLCHKVFGEDLEKIAYYSFITTEFEGQEIILSRTGYTGEKGVEIFFKSKFNETLWDKLLLAGKEFGIEPCGLGVRDILRLEMGYPLHGHELKGHTPIDIKKTWCVEWNKPDFIGKKKLISQKEKGFLTTLTAFVVSDKGIPREGYEVFKGEKKIGIVTSGGFSPKLKKGIGLCLIDLQETNIGNTIDIMIRGKRVPANITKLPFIPSRVK